MDVATLWMIPVFLLSFFAYLSYSVVCLDVVASTLVSPELRTEEYSLAPLSDLFKNPERLISVLSYSRLFFLMPQLILAYWWTQHLGLTLTIGTLVSLMVLLFLIPEWLASRASLSPFKVTVQLISYFPLYLALWAVSKMAPGEVRSQALEEEKKTNGETQEEESEEFKGDILRAISTIGETTVREVMTPRVDMVCISAAGTLGELHKLFRDSKFSRLPVYKEKIDNVVGTVSLVDFVSHLPGYDLSAPVTDILRPALYVPETKKVHTLLREFRESHGQMAIVIDEYGGTSGLVTLEDLLEEIVGEIEDEYDEAPFESLREKDGAYLVTGKFPVAQFEETFGLEIPAEDFETISGLIFSIVGRIPMVGEIIKYRNLNLEILEADKRRIHRVRIKALPQEESPEEAQEN